MCGLLCCCVPFIRIIVVSISTTHFSVCAHLTFLVDQRFRKENVNMRQAKEITVAWSRDKRLPNHNDPVCYVIGENNGIVYMRRCIFLRSTSTAVVLSRRT